MVFPLNRYIYYIMNKQLLQVIMAACIISSFFTGCLVQRRPATYRVDRREERYYRHYHRHSDGYRYDPNRPPARY